MIYFAAGLALCIGSAVVAAYWLGMQSERARWYRLCEGTVCWRCGGTGAEPVLRRKGRWAQ